ncbi:hypothetical protein [Cecembia rubra]|nr:hypothetical protein [Cecembia rubra]
MCAKVEVYTPKTPAGVYYRWLLAPSDNSGIWDGMSIVYSNSGGVEQYSI